MTLLLILLSIFLPSVAFSATETVASRAFCCTNDQGSNCCVDNIAPDGAQDCVDGSPYCSDGGGDASCTSPPYSTCSLDTSSDFYAAGDVALDIFDVNFDDPCVNTSQIVVIRGAGGFQTASVGLFRLNTIDVPDNHTVTAGALELYITFVQETGTDNLSLLCDYTDWNAGIAGCGEDDFSVSPGAGNAFSIPIDTLIPELGQIVSIPLSNLSFINKEGFTYFKCTISWPGDFQTDGTNQVQINASDGTHPGPRIRITSSVLEGCCDCTDPLCAEPIDVATCPEGCSFTPNAVCQ